ncbi:MAG: Isoquinoline 1-oxidoreductase subunit, partial [Gemmatimonadales bacterium]
RQLLDPAQSHQTPAGLADHVTSDPLVLWGWQPGPGRKPPSMSHAEFVALVTEWVRAGAACPA